MPQSSYADTIGMESHDRIRFNRNPDFYPLLKERVFGRIAVQSSGRFATTQTKLKCGFIGILTTASYVWLLKSQDSHEALCFGFLYGILVLILALNVGHDASHYCFVKNRGMNRVLQRMTFLLVGVDSFLWRFRHTKSHHIMPNVNGSDIDIDENFFFRFSPNQPYKTRFQFQHLYAPLVYFLVVLHTVYFQDFVYLYKKRLANLREIKLPLFAYISCFSTKLAHVAISIFIPAYFLNVNLVWIALSYLLITFVISTFFTYSLVGTHFSDLCDFPTANSNNQLPFSWAEHSLKTSCDWAPTSRLAISLMGGLNCHAAHHLFPNIAHSHNRIIVEELINLEQAGHLKYNRVSLREMVASHFRFLKQLGKRPEVAALCLVFVALRLLSFSDIALAEHSLSKHATTQDGKVTLDVPNDWNVLHPGDESCTSDFQLCLITTDGNSGVWIRSTWPFAKGNLPANFPLHDAATAMLKGMKKRLIDVQELPALETEINHLAAIRFALSGIINETGAPKTKIYYTVVILRGRNSLYLMAGWTVMEQAIKSVSKSINAVIQSFRESQSQS